jgi:uncharacterized protein YacL
MRPVEAAQRQRVVLLRIVRMAFALLIFTIALVNASQITLKLSIQWWVPIVIGAAFVAIGLLVDIFTPNKKISAISSVFMGLLVGMLATLAVSALIDLLIKNTITDTRALESIAPFVSTLKVMIGMTFSYLGVVTILQTQDDFRLVIPYVEFSKQIRGPKPLLLDTSSLIDARIADVAATGIIQSPIVIPRFVIAELQLLADSSDRLRRARGRRGLDVTTRLQRSAIDLTIDETPVPGKAVDQMLVELARQMPATIITADVGLSRVAQIHGVSVLNLNDVANALKPALLPGETLVVRIIKAGEQANQGVGYLDDGTMVVAENAALRIGEDASLLVTSTLQTSAGRLIFAKLADEVAGSRSPLLAAGPAASGTRTGGPEDQTPDQNIRNDAGQPGPDEAPGVSPDAAESAAGEPGAAAERRPGPFPTRPPIRRSSARNPRR